MPLVDYSLKIIKAILSVTDHDREQTGRVLCLSHPDVIASVGTLVSIFGAEAASLPIREDGQLSINWHKAQAITSEIVDTKALFALLGYEMDAIDITEGRGGEIIHDLSTPLPEQYRGKYDLVFDCISNQCFNVAQVWANMVMACRVGGSVLSVTPVTMINQGFWDVSPTAYHDFFTANGMKISYRAIHGVYSSKGEVVLDPVIRCRGVPEDTMNCVFGLKLADVNPVQWPVMAKFRRYPQCQITTPTKSPL